MIFYYVLELAETKLVHKHQVEYIAKYNTLQYVYHAFKKIKEQNILPPKLLQNVKSISFFELKQVNKKKQSLFH